MNTFIEYAVLGIGYTGLILILLSLYLLIIKGYVKTIHRIRKIDYKWLLFLSTAYRNRNNEDRHEELKDLIDTAYVRNRWLDATDEEKYKTLEILKEVEHIVKEKIKYCEAKLKNE